MTMRASTFEFKPPREPWSGPCLDSSSAMSAAVTPPPLASRSALPGSLLLMEPMSFSTSSAGSGGRQIVALSERMSVATSSCPLPRERNERPSENSVSFRLPVISDGMPVFSAFHPSERFLVFETARMKS